MHPHQLNFTSLIESTKNNESTMTLALTPEEIEQLQFILKKYLPSTAEVWVFGSRVSGKNKPFSDVDLLIKDHNKIDRKIMNALDYALEESAFPFKVDLVDWQSINESFKKTFEQQPRIPLLFSFTR